ncbi:MAG: DUF2497 domain-containing protein [Proteobacteria bacterium]|nr:DUF2497 domain-containing protein [Pseudomonadota bacterium]
MGKTDEPSMEEILSSIKRIIAEDSDGVTPRRGRAAPAEEPDVLELTQALGEPDDVVEEAPAAPPFTIAAEEAPALAEAPVAPPPEEPAAEALVSSASADATRAALAALSRMVVKPEEPAADNTLEGLVREMLRPMMKDWLDANLPRIVQEAVDREVKRIAGQGS